MPGSIRSAVCGSMMSLMLTACALPPVTTKKGPVSAYTAAELARVNAGWTFRRGDAYPYRDHPVGIPTLREALRSIPSGIPVILDMKALPAAPQTQAVARVLDEAY